MNTKKLSNRKIILLSALIALAVAILVIAVLQHGSVDVMVEYIFLLSGIPKPVVI